MRYRLVITTINIIDREYKLKSDIIIIGSGPVGASCARNLAEKGLNVLILEAGEAISTPPGSHLRNQLKYQINPDSFFTEIDKWCKKYKNSGEPRELPGANITQAYGGQGLLWTNNCPRLLSHALLSMYTLKEWDKLYAQAEEYLYVNSALFNNSVRQKNIIETLSGVLDKQQRSIEKVPLAAKRIDEKTLHFIATYDILDILPSVRERITVKFGKKVKKLLVKNAHIYHVEVEASGQLEYYSAERIIIAGGAFDTTQLLYNSYIRPSALGRYLHFHPLIMAQLVLNNALCAPENIYDQPPRTCIYPTEAYPWHAMILRDIFPEVSTETVHENALIDMQFFVPIEIQKHNRMILSDDVPRFDVHLSERDERILKSARNDLIDISKKLGRFRQGAEPVVFDYGFTHPMGMCRLGEDPQTSVADCYGRVHGYQNLYLATVGLIPCTMAVNPTLTAVALAIATGNHIVANTR